VGSRNSPFQRLKYVNLKRATLLRQDESHRAQDLTIPLRLFKCLVSLNVGRTFLVRSLREEDACPFVQLTVNGYLSGALLDQALLSFLI
jgi:hypothetical protein